MIDQSPIFDVSGAVAVLNQTLDYALPHMTVVGELANFKIAKKRWVYADIKDEHAKLRMFGSIYDLPGPLQDGMQIEVVGRPQIHPQYGFSFTIQSIKPVGEGSIKKAADMLKLKLEKEGLFDEDRKRPIPFPPSRLGLIASTESAAYVDFIKVLDGRWQGVEIEVFDAQVQGEAAVESILAGIQYFNQRPVLPDTLVLTRGGGSADDLSAFDVEQVVRAVAASRIPTAVAVGHEVDISLSELAADMRASTPSNAAELLFPDRREFQAKLGAHAKYLDDIVQGYVDAKHAELQHLDSSLVRKVETVIDQKAAELANAHTLLEAFHPKSTMARGYALVQTASGTLIRLKTQVNKGDIVEITLKDGSIGSKVERV